MVIVAETLKDENIINIVYWEFEITRANIYANEVIPA